MKTIPLITIIICTYNRYKFLQEAINSIKNQTWKNLEIIIIDDGSTDQTKAYLSMIEMNDSRFRVLSINLFQYLMFVDKLVDNKRLILDEVLDGEKNRDRGKSIINELLAELAR